jgi:hypothetical protein
MELATGNLLCNKTVHKREMSIKGSISAGNRFLCPCVSKRSRYQPLGTSQGAVPNN